MKVCSVVVHVSVVRLLFCSVFCLVTAYSGTPLRAKLAMPARSYQQIETPTHPTKTNNEPHPPQNNNTNATRNPHQEARIQAPENTHPAQRHSPTTVNHPLANTPAQHPPTSEVSRTPQPHVRHAPPTATVHKVRPKCAHAKPPRGRKQLAMYIFFGKFPLKTRPG